MDQRHAYADIIVDLSAKAADKIYQYKIPEEISGSLLIGSLALVPFNKRRSLGYVVGTSNKPRRLKLLEIIDIIDKEPQFSPDSMDLCQWISNHYQCSLSDCLRLLLPPGGTHKVRKLFDLDKSLIDSDSREKLNDISLPATKNIFITKLGRIFFEKELKKGSIKVVYKLAAPRVSVKKKRIITRGKSGNPLDHKLGEKQKKLLEIVVDKGELGESELLSMAKAGKSSLDSLLKKGLVESHESITARSPKWINLGGREKVRELTADQSSALKSIYSSIDKGEGDIFLLKGVTGSGKTEVYLRAIEKVVKRGQGAIVLVPEISLTSQLGDSLIEKFKNEVAILHSSLSDGERHDEWHRIKNKQASVVIGARSAIFAPLDDLGIIIVDEEHETTYKQNVSPRYNAKDIAVRLSLAKKAITLLGSATPSLESMNASDNGIYKLVELPERIGKRKLPKIQLLDMKKEIKSSHPAISQKLVSAIDDALSKDEKVIIFLNRRGYSSLLLCGDCGDVPKCSNCSISLSYHRGENRLKCHHCNFSVATFLKCPNCGGHNFKYLGMGTEKIEDNLSTLFKEVTIVRMDSDTTSKKGSHQELLKKFNDSRGSILLGTQMIAKGLDFPEVSLIGVIDADVALNLPDFRAGERTFQMLMQVAGRSGRGEVPGKVMVQTYSPENYAIQAAAHGDYDAFYDKEISFRKELDYPPIADLINIVISGNIKKDVEERASELGEFLRNQNFNEKTFINGPGAAPIERIKNRWRWHLFISTFDPVGVKSIMSKNWSKHFIEKKGTRVIVDVDPMWLL